MVTITLDERDREALERLRDGDADAGSLAEHVGCDPSYLRTRLPELADNGLAERVDDGYAITASGERAIASTPVGREDDRVDTPAEVERQLESFDLRVDREAAVRSAFAFLSYWDAVSEGELVDAVYSEHPAGFESHEEWWTEFVREHLADLPQVEPPDSTDLLWRFTGAPGVEEPTEDGRTAPGDAVPMGSSVTFALEHLDMDDEERSAIRAAFDRLVWASEVSATDLRESVYPDHDAGYGSASEWWDDCIRPAFGHLPGVQPSDESGHVWQYRQPTEGSMSSDPGANVPDGPPGRADENEE